jgi:hypothetical protein
VSKDELKKPTDAEARFHWNRLFERRGGMDRIRKQGGIYAKNKPAKKVDDVAKTVKQVQKPFTKEELAQHKKDCEEVLAEFLDLMQMLNKKRLQDRLECEEALDYWDRLEKFELETRPEHFSFVEPTMTYNRKMLNDEIAKINELIVKNEAMCVEAIQQKEVAFKSFDEGVGVEFDLFDFINSEGVLT